MARILVVEEEEQTFAVLCLALEQAGHAVERAGACNRESDAELGEGFDVMVTDTPMPEWCGPSFLSELRKRSPALKVIALAGGGEAGAVGYLPSLARFGAVCILRKPFAYGELIEAVRWAMSSEPGGRDGWPEYDLRP